MSPHLNWLDEEPRRLDEEASAAARARQAQLTKPPGALGELETLAITLAGWQGRVQPSIERVNAEGEPIMLAIAAVTLSTMHQSSLGSLFLLMPDKLAPQWWSPVMPVSFLLSAICRIRCSGISASSTSDSTTG